MRIIDKTVLLFFYAAVVVISIHLLGFEAVASEGSGNWRGTYDLVMRWINFAIIVFLIVKYGKKPVMNFLRGQKKDLEEEIGRLEEEKNKVTAKIRDTYKIIDESDERFDSLKDKIIKQGKRKSQRILKEAKEQSRLTLEEAKRKVGSHIIQAKKVFRAELVDTAIDLAMERLPQEVTKEDNEKLLKTYFDKTVTKQEL